MKFTLSTIAILSLGFSISAFAEECKTESPEILPNQPTLGQIIEGLNEGAIDQKDGVIFACSQAEITQLKKDMAKYFRELDINPALVVTKTSKDGTKFGLNLNTPANDTNTLDLGKRPELDIHDEVVVLPTADGKTRQIATVSRKEIALAMFQHGRRSEFSGPGCKIQAFKDYIGIRQNTSAWTEELDWGFPDGRSAAWNPEFWDDSPMPKKGPLHVAINDLFINQKEYSMGCYTASKAVMMQGVLDYYARVRPDAKKLAEVESRLLANKAPFTGLEPGTAWDFLSSITEEELRDPGSVLTVKKEVAPRNFIPGDWVYIKNTDDPSSDLPGYEGSNAVYLGRNRFDDYYNEVDKRHYTFEEKIDEVYQWRHGAFTGSAESQAKRKPLTPEQFESLLKHPKEGGILIHNRIEPMIL